MPHSMQGTRGQVRFRGKNSPRFRREQEQAELAEKKRAERMAVLEKRLQAEREARAKVQAKARTVGARVGRAMEHVRGFAARLLRRGVQ